MSRTTSRSHVRVHFSKHAVLQMAERHYTKDEIGKMLSTIDPRLVVEIITVLPKAKDKAKDQRLQKLLALRAELAKARQTLKSCTKQKSKDKWHAEVERLERDVGREYDKHSGST